MNVMCRYVLWVLFSICVSSLGFPDAQAYVLISHCDYYEENKSVSDILTTSDQAYRVKMSNPEGGYGVRDAELTGVDLFGRGKSATVTLKVAIMEDRGRVMARKERHDSVRFLMDYADNPPGYGYFRQDDDDVCGIIPVVSPDVEYWVFLDDGRISMFEPVSAESRLSDWVTGFVGARYAFNEDREQPLGSSGGFDDYFGKRKYTSVTYIKMKSKVVISDDDMQLLHLMDAEDVSWVNNIYFNSMRPTYFPHLISKYTAYIAGKFVSGYFSVTVERYERCTSNKLSGAIGVIYLDTSGRHPIGGIILVPKNYAGEVPDVRLSDSRLSDAQWECVK